VASRTSLRQFQQDLAVRLSSAKAEPASTARLGVQCGGEYWLIDLTEAGEIMAVPVIAPVPLTRHWYAGLANARGTLVSVVDFSAFATGKPTQRGPENRLVLVNARLGINSALLVSRLLGLRNPRDFVRMDAESSGKPWTGGRWTDQAGMQWRELSLAPLVAMPEFLHVGN
jgi:twitching motility protein PilI